MSHHAHAHHQHPRDNHRVRNAHELYKAETVYNVVYVTASPTFDGPIAGYKTIDGSGQQQAQSQQPSIAAAPVQPSSPPVNTVPAAPIQSSSPPANAVPAMLAPSVPANSPSPPPETQAVPTTPTTSPAESTTAEQPVVQPTTTPVTISKATATSSSPSAVVSSDPATSKADHSVHQTLSETLVPTNSVTSSSPKLETPIVASAANAQSTSRSIPATSESASGGMPGGAKAGLAIGILLAISALAGLIFFCLRRRRNHRKQAYSRASDEKAGPGSEGAAVGLGRSASVQTSNTFATAPRLSLRPVTQFLPDIAAQRKSGNNFAVAAGPLRHNAPMSQAADAEKVAVNNGSNDPANPFGNHAEMSEKQSIQRDSENPINPFGNHAQTDRQLTGAGAEPEVIPPAPLRIRTPTPDGKAVETGTGAAAVGATGVRAGEEKNVSKPLNLSPNRAGSPATNGMPSPTASDFSTTPVSPGTFANGPPPSNVHRIQLDFKPSMDDELELRAGQLVRLLHEYDDGWALCIRLDRSQQGVAPRTCLSARPVKPRPPPGARGPPPRGPPPPGMFSNQQRPASPANGRGSPRPYNQAPRSTSPSPAPSQRSMSPGPYGGSRQRPTIPPPGGKRRSSSAGAVRERRNSPVGPSPMNPNAQRVPMQLQAVTAPGQVGSQSPPQGVARKPVPGQAM